MELQNFQTGWSIDCSAGFIIGADISYTAYTPLTGQYGVSYGVLSPQGGCAVSNSVEVR